MATVLDNSILNKYTKTISKIDPIKYTGTVIRVSGLTVVSRGPKAVIGEVCQIILPEGNAIACEVIGLQEKNVTLMCYDEMEGIEIGCTVIATGSYLSVGVGENLLGRVLDGKGKPLDDRGEIGAEDFYSIFNPPAHVLKRKRIEHVLQTGVKSIDGLFTIGMGQRVGIFSGSGVGKSTLLGMIARNTNADVNVIALIGERGREVREFIEKNLGEEGMAHSILVVASSNKPPLSRIRGAYVATTIAEYFRDRGNNVFLMMDSVTRFARAQREIGLAAGEPPANRGFTPSVFALLPKLLERAGTGESGSITGFYTVLVEGDDLDEPVSDAVRGILDGHIVLSRRLAELNHYPAIDALSSISRLADELVSKGQSEQVNRMKNLVAVYREAEDLINVGAYAEGSNPEIDEAIKYRDAIREFLKQGISDKFTYEETVKLLAEIIK